MKLVAAIVLVLSQVSLRSCRSRHAVSFVHDASSEVTLVSPHKVPTLAQLIPILEGVEPPETKISKLKKLIEIYDELNNWRLNNGKQLVKIMPLEKKIKMKPLGFILAKNNPYKYKNPIDQSDLTEEIVNYQIKDDKTEKVDNYHQEPHHTRHSSHNSTASHKQHSEHSATHTHSHIHDEANPVEVHHMNEDVVYNIKQHHNEPADENSGSDSNESVYEESKSESNEHSESSSSNDKEFATDIDELHSGSYMDADSRYNDFDAAEVNNIDLDSESIETSLVSTLNNVVSNSTTEAIAYGSASNQPASSSDSIEDTESGYDSDLNESDTNLISLSNENYLDSYFVSKSSEQNSNSSQSNEDAYVDMKSDSVSESSESSSKLYSNLIDIDSESSSESGYYSESEPNESDLVSTENIEVNAPAHNARKYHSNDDMSVINYEEEVVPIEHKTNNNDNDVEKSIVSTLNIEKHDGTRRSNIYDESNDGIEYGVHKHHENDDGRSSVDETSHKKPHVNVDTSGLKGHDESEIGIEHTVDKHHKHDAEPVTIIAHKKHEHENDDGCQSNESAVVTRHVAHKHHKHEHADADISGERVVSIEHVTNYENDEEKMHQAEKHENIDNDNRESIAAAKRHYENNNAETVEAHAHNVHKIYDKDIDNNVNDESEIKDHENDGSFEEDESFVITTSLAKTHHDNVESSDQYSNKLSSTIVTLPSRLHRKNVHRRKSYKLSFIFNK